MFMGCVYPHSVTLVNDQLTSVKAMRKTAVDHKEGFLLNLNEQHIQFEILSAKTRKMYRIQMRRLCSHLKIHFYKLKFTFTLDRIFVKLDGNYIGTVTGSNKGIGFSIVEKLAEFYGASGEWDIYLTGEEFLVHNLTARNVELGQEAVEKLSNKGLVVNVSSSLSLFNLLKLSDDLYEKFVGQMNLFELKELMEEFVKSAEDGTYSEKGWVSSAYAVSKIGVTKASFIFGEMLKDDPRRIVVNSCCPGFVDTDMTDHKGVKTTDEGADTPFYLATLPIDSKEPNNQFVYERKVVKWSK
ncbi:putative carbonyl reductase [Schistosoma mansoni]|uniref:putative carbonyl reductase n=1 Tax=Schistosoma mansoni TaxID=6183 RepID=UPI00022DCAE0|nr:putative carbonyl reductase [Schistosoma mansoni]|eukprot:XP_018654148.1 putative carbonyl reductase [Schistosoma mansoni]